MAIGEPGRTTPDRQRLELYKKQAELLYRKSILLVGDAKSPLSGHDGSRAFLPRGAFIGAVAAIGVWCVIVGVSSVITHTFLTPVAIILALGIVPVALVSGYTLRA